MMPRLVSRQRVMVLAVTLACTMAAVTTLINGALLDRQIDQRSIVLNLIQVLGLGFCLSYLMGLKLMQLTLASQKLEQIASYDFLTDALTRARFFAQIAAQASTALRPGQPDGRQSAMPDLTLGERILAISDTRYGIGEPTFAALPPVREWADK